MGYLFALIPDGEDEIFVRASENTAPFDTKLFRYTPSTNAFVGVGNVPTGPGTASLIPAPVSIFTPNICTAFMPVAVDVSNNSWVPIVDSKGDVLAEIQPNGNDLGTIDVEAYIHDGAIRKDGQGTLILTATSPSTRKMLLQVLMLSFASILQKRSLKH
ncbi:MAG: hypothetical protein QM763_07285 [Agriterribacter sp.]